VYESATGALAFGDVFSAKWFFDAYLRRDAVPLVAFQERAGGQAWRAAAPSGARDLVFAHGQQRKAVLLGDDCEIETMLRRSGRSRVIFAAIEELPPDAMEAENLLQTRAFRRFPLPPGDGFTGGIVDFQQLFAMNVDGVQAGEDGIDPRLVSLDAETKLLLEMRWNAFAVRRGPLTHLDNAEKFARLLTADGDGDRLDRLHRRVEDPVELDAEIGRALIAALNAAWEVEGAVLNRMAEAYERKEAPDATRREIAEALEKLASRAQRAAALTDPGIEPTGSPDS
jgi:hypothetical protein